MLNTGSLTITDTSSPLYIPHAEVGTVTGFLFVGSGASDIAFSFTCPCGVTQSCSPNNFPTVDTPHKCGNPNHYFAKFED